MFLKHILKSIEYLVKYYLYKSAFHKNFFLREEMEWPSLQMILFSPADSGVNLAPEYNRCFLCFSYLQTLLIMNPEGATLVPLEHFFWQATKNVPHLLFF